MKATDMTGRVYGRLVVVRRAGAKGTGTATRALWLCVCSAEHGGCGREYIAQAGSLRRGSTKSCGCLARDAQVARQTTHGHAARGQRSPEYKTWAAMVDRCENPQNKAFSHYGGRGIAVCARWRSFKDFLTDAGSRPSPKHSIDRIDNDRGYEPGNVRWATQKEQTRNTRANKLLTFNGETLCMSEWAERTGIGSPTIRTRLVLGWSVADALTRPVTFMPRWHKEVAQ